MTSFGLGLVDEGGGASPPPGEILRLTCDRLRYLSDSIRYLVGSRRHQFALACAHART